MLVPSLCQEDPLEEEMATHSNSPGGIISWTEKPGGFHGFSWWVLIVPGIAKS